MECTRRGCLHYTKRLINNCDLYENVAECSGVMFEKKKTEKASDKQIGGSHYSDYKIQPFHFITVNNLSYGQGNVIKYVMRYKQKNGIQDLEKIKHYVDLLIEEYNNEVHMHGLQKDN